MIRLPIPALNAERRQELVKVAHKYAESARVAVRNVRRDGMELLKKLDKDGQMSEDDHHKNSAKVQELTDKLIKEIDQSADRQGSRDQAGMRVMRLAAPRSSRCRRAAHGQFVRRQGREAMNKHNHRRLGSRQQPQVPRHVAIIMDGNGRWAQSRGLPRSAGHRMGVEAVRRTVARRWSSACST